MRANLAIIVLSICALGADHAGRDTSAAIYISAALLIVALRRVTARGGEG